jgi:hypothetical protein
MADDLTHNTAMNESNPTPQQEQDSPRKQDAAPNAQEPNAQELNAQEPGLADDEALTPIKPFDEQTAADAGKCGGEDKGGPPPRCCGIDNSAPCWLAGLCGLALILMFNQIKLPIAGGRIALADLGFAAAFIGMIWHLWRKRLSVYYPAAALLALTLVTVPNIISQPGSGGALKLFQLVQQLFCGLLLLSFMLEHLRRLTKFVVTIAIALNVGLAISQALSYGYDSVLAPADAIGLFWGFGGALTGFFRSRMAMSFFFAAVLAWGQPQWLGKRPNKLRWLFALIMTLLCLNLISHGQMLLIVCMVLLVVSFLTERRVVVLNLLAIGALLLSLMSIAPHGHRETLLQTLSPTKLDDRYAGELKTRHLDALAALKMAARKPLTGVGSSRYQDCIGRCYGTYPNPSYNDINTDSQAGWGILAATVGFPAAGFFFFFLLMTCVTGLRRHFMSRRQNTLALGGSMALMVFIPAMCISDPLTRGLGWLLALAIASAVHHNEKEGMSLVNLFPLSRIILAGVFFVVLLALVAIQPKAEDPLLHRAGPHMASTSRPHKAANDAAGDGASQPQTSIFFKVIDADDVLEFTAPFEKVSDSQAAKQTALSIPDGKGTPPENEEPAMEYGGAIFKVETPNDMRCKLWLRVWWDGSCGNTINVRLNDEERSLTVGNDGTYHSWHWLEADRLYELNAGEHRFTLLNREDGIMFDQMILTNDLNYYPQGIEEE